MLASLPENVMIVIVVSIALVVLLVPLILRVAGLTGQQIVDVVTMTTKFFLELIREFRNENQGSP